MVHSYTNFSCMLWLLNIEPINYHRSIIFCDESIFFFRGKQKGVEFNFFCIDRNGILDIFFLFII